MSDTLVTPFGVDLNLTPLFEGFSTSVDSTDAFITSVDSALSSDLTSILGILAPEFF